MANEAVTNLRGARSLAHKLFLQCRESPSSYKLLAGSVKELRNVLEDIEDRLDGPGTVKFDDAVLSDHLSHCKELLDGLDYSLQSFRCSRHDDVEESTVADFKTALDHVQTELRVAQDGVTDTTVPVSSSESKQERTSQEDVNSCASEEKEVFDLGAAYLQQSPGSSRGTAAPRASMDWKAKFRDPMSISIEQASSWILSTPDASPVNTSTPKSNLILGPAIASPVSDLAHESRAGAGLGISDTTAQSDHRFPPRIKRARRSNEILRDELSTIINTALTTPTSLLPKQDVREHRDSHILDSPPPPARKAPLPPRARRPPKIPQRSATYRIVNTSWDDSSSEEEDDNDDLYSTSRPGTPDDTEKKLLPSKARLDNTRPAVAKQVPIDNGSRQPIAVSPLPSERTFTNDEATSILQREDLDATPSKSAEKSASPRLKRSQSSHEPLKGSQTLAPNEAGPFENPAFDEEASTASMPGIQRSDDQASNASSIRTDSVIDDDATDPTHTVSEHPTATDALNSKPRPNHREWYAPGPDTTSNALDKEHIAHIIHFFNQWNWHQAQRYLEGYLQSLTEQDELARARRVRHLIGVSLSLLGQWSTAIPWFLSAMRSPIKRISELDDGDCAAAYWLGDCYSLLNRRTEALLAYGIAERMSFFQHPTATNLALCIIAEQDAVRRGLKSDTFETHWTATNPPGSESSGDSILDPRVIEKSTARSLFTYSIQRVSLQSFQLDPNKSRCYAFVMLGNLPSTSPYIELKLISRHFEPDTPWPVLFDPLFTMANVRNGRLLTYECDLLAVFSSNPNAKVPKSSSLAFNRVDCFTATDLPWLINTIRACLRMLEMQWSEVATVEGTSFYVRYSFMMSKIATTNYFSIALFKPPLRSGYGVDICPNGIVSARIVRVDWEHLYGVHMTESKRIKKLIREFLDEAAKEEISLATTTTMTATGQRLQAANTSVGNVSTTTQLNAHGSVKTTKPSLMKRLRPTK